MLETIQRLPFAQRLVIFILFFGGGLLLIVILAIALIRNSLQQSGTRSQSVALVEGVTVREFAQLPDDDAYPAAVAVAADGRVYTGSFKTGVLWVIDSSGKVTEIPGSRDQIGAVAGLTVAPDGTVYIVDQNDSDPYTNGGSLKRLTADGTINDFASINDEQGLVTPDDVTLDTAGHVYVSDRGRDAVWRFDSDGSGGAAWWTPPLLEDIERYEPTGLAYDAMHDALLVTDGLNDTLYRVPVADPGAAELLYRHGTRPNSPGFDGLTVTPDGTIYIAALGQIGIARLEGDNLTYIAGLFRGPSDVDYSPVDQQLYVTNWDQYSLANTAVHPYLPFALDVIEFG
jgi:sugar lactone lactonase YvrE